jgi:hypothetical protein
MANPCAAGPGKWTFGVICGREKNVSGFEIDSLPFQAFF